MSSGPSGREAFDWDKATAGQRCGHLYRGLVGMAEGRGGMANAGRNSVNGNACPGGTGPGHKKQGSKEEASRDERLSSPGVNRRSGLRSENRFQASHQFADIDRLAQKGEGAAAQGGVAGAVILVGGHENHGRMLAAPVQFTLQFDA